MDTVIAFTQDLPFPISNQKTVKQVLEHGKQVAKYCQLIALQMGLGESAAKELKQAAIFHDIGEVLIPKTLLDKPNALTLEEYKCIQAHATNGYTILKQGASKLMQASAELALKHHENLDGSGYPAGLSEQDLSIEDRIIRVADTFDAITSWRPYRPAGSHEDALMVLWLDASKHFDREVIEALERVLKQDPDTTVTTLSETQIEYIDGLIKKLKEANGVLS